jgi:uncharacterized protein YegP (UPF0339 family)
MAAKFEIYEDNAGELHWRLVHANGQVMAESGEVFKAKANAIIAVNSVKENAPGAAVEDKTHRPSGLPTTTIPPAKSVPAS